MLVCDPFLRKRHLIQYQSAGAQVTATTFRLEPYSRVMWGHRTET